MNDKIQQSRKLMDKAIEHLRSEFSKMRVGRASAAMVEGVRVEVYGSSMTLREMAAIAIPDPKTITIQPWDRSLMGDIEKAILAANLGLTPINDGKLIRIVLPPMTEDRRKDFVKSIKKWGEDAKVSVRNIRRDLIDGFKSSKEISEDDLRRAQDEVQKITDTYVQDVDKLVDAKSKEVMTL